MMGQMSGIYRHRIAEDFALDWSRAACIHIIKLHTISMHASTSREAPLP